MLAKKRTASAFCISTMRYGEPPDCVSMLRVPKLSGGFVFGVTVAVVTGLLTVFDRILWRYWPFRLFHR
ncbi:hypothetical protein XH94_30470 [Bradyrhizobium zhanjiangense]|uniref:Uncharacterized protein n=1 Tax=Bradyrhizobium zhanjiangense TaxID=1325107 RepID=A0A4Q0SB40_9BRAD|nr:hypothetical protein XH94_30470 [Bradyrhizobium zhanjiangense]